MVGLECRKAYPNHYARVNAHDPRHGRRTIALQFMVHRPKEEPGFRLDRVETNDRHIAYTLHCRRLRVLAVEGSTR